MIDIQPKKLYSATELETIRAALDAACEAGVTRYDADRSAERRRLYCGTGDPLSPKWNVQIYEPPPHRTTCRITSTDLGALSILVNEGIAALVPSDKKVVRIDDVGWGFPLCGVGIGAELDGRMERALLPVTFFRHDTGPNAYETGLYKRNYVVLGVALLEKLGAQPETHRIEICSGHINAALRDKLRELGWEVRVVEVPGQLRDELELAYAEYVHKATGADLYYDPKVTDELAVRRGYNAAIRYGREKCPGQLKTGWSALEQYR